MNNNFIFEIFVNIFRVKKREASILIFITP